MKRGAGNHHRTSGGRWLKVPWCLPPRPRCVLPETPRGEENVLVPAPQQRATTPGEPWQTSSRVWSRLPKDTLVPAAPICSALAAADSSEWCPAADARQKRSVAAHRVRGAQQLPISKHSASPVGCCSPTFGALLDCPGAPRLSTRYLAKAPKKL